jgi:oligopeptide/dipeptide ABC transporter ATP-binding protein
MTSDVLTLEGLKVYFHTPAGIVKACDRVGFGLRPQERFGLVGESGSGKTTMALGIMRMIKPPGRIEGGKIMLQGKDLMGLTEEEMRHVRLAEIAMIPQGSMNSLNPVMRVKAQLADALNDHGVQLSGQEFRAKIEELFNWVGLRPFVADMYPHELSGGMKQRVCIAIGICMQPKVIIADEPTSALDVVVQRQVMETLIRVQGDIGASVILVGHDMGLMAQVVDRLGVMYAGKLVEVSPVREIFTQPVHPYTQMLIASLPSLEGKGAFKGIPGLPPLLRDIPPGCSFAPRCPQAIARCREEEPLPREVRPDCVAACHLA